MSDDHLNHNMLLRLCALRSFRGLYILYGFLSIVHSSRPMDRTALLFLLVLISPSVLCSCRCCCHCFYFVSFHLLVCLVLVPRYTQNTLWLCCLSLSIFDRHSHFDCSYFSPCQFIYLPYIFFLFFVPFRIVMCMFLLWVLHFVGFFPFVRLFGCSFSVCFIGFIYLHMELLWFLMRVQCSCVWWIQAAFGQLCISISMRSHQSRLHQ